MVSRRRPFLLSFFLEKKKKGLSCAGARVSRFRRRGFVRCLATTRGRRQTRPRPDPMKGPLVRSGRLAVCPQHQRIFVAGAFAVHQGSTAFFLRGGDHGAVCVQLFFVCRHLKSFSFFFHIYSMHQKSPSARQRDAVGQPFCVAACR
ncbi:hypothetical protein [Pandoravirus japonicus]|uniref:Uncharacterized protein n=1 Tax=Pandoravirus japonicus TaxID=2823154 RepID=A0A811BMQ0_9VIRU|nr:hypothetical protein [Pandoravirus japonicus]